MSRKQFPEPVEALILILAIFAGLIVLLFLYTLIFGVGLTPQAIQKETRYLYIFGGSLFLIVPVLYSMVFKYNLRRLFRLNPIPGRVVVLSLLTGIGLTVVGDELDRLINMIIPIPEWLLEQMQPLQAENNLDWALIITGAVVIAAVAEEALFRGFFQVTLERKGDATRAVLLSSITWTLIHMNPYWAIQIFVTGVVIGYLAWRTDSLLPAVIVHALNNLLAVLALNLIGKDESLGWYEWGDHVSPPVLIVGLVLLVLSLRQIGLIYRPPQKVD